jgi:hypothetical protein
MAGASTGGAEADDARALSLSLRISGGQTREFVMDLIANLLNYDAEQFFTVRGC